MELNELKAMLNYNSSTGLFSWLVPPSNFVKAGSKAGNINPVNGYEVIKIKGKCFKSHRLAWLFVHGKFPSKHVDHINGVRHDNRICNLREANDSQNQQNLRGKTSRNTSGFLGVSYRKSTGKFVAMIKYGGKNRHLGAFDTAEEASRVYLEHKRKHHPFGTI